MRRRSFIGGVASVGATLASPVRVRAQTPPARIGVLVGPTTTLDPFLKDFRERLLALGYVEGRTFNLEIRVSEGRVERSPLLAAELVREKVDVIVALQTPNAEAAKSATSAIPIVMIAGDPVGTGLIANLARPGGNITGISTATAEASGKCVQFLREMLPALKRVAAVCNSLDPFSKPFLEQIQQAGAALGVAAVPLFYKGPGGFEAAFASEPAVFDAAVIQPSLGATIPAEFAVVRRIPSASPNRVFALAGGLLSYSGNQAQMFRDAADYVDKILKGTRPADLPVQQPTVFDLVVNKRAAAALGLSIPPSLLATADEIVE
ncbi:MAG: hypothetical protein FJX55_00880 [Alphaproteobacteria bacterium]|nr:hypothetical protein [Alphaproteobacteria bacterium]